jgi:hypothetical protein
MPDAVRHIRLVALRVSTTLMSGWSCVGSGYPRRVAIAAGLCFGIAICWWPLAWLTKFRAQNNLDLYRQRSDRPAWATDRPLERLAQTAQWMLTAWWIAVVAAGAGVILVVLAYTA